MLSDNIKKLRLARNISQVQLANELGISKQAVSNWENNNIQPSVDMLVALADFFRTSTDFLLDRDNAKAINVEGLSIEKQQHICMIIKDMLK